MRKKGEQSRKGRMKGRGSVSVRLTRIKSLESDKARSWQNGVVLFTRKDDVASMQTKKKKSVIVMRFVFVARALIGNAISGAL